MGVFSTIILAVLVSQTCCCFCCVATTSPPVVLDTTSPLIGILSQPFSSSLHNATSPGDHYIAASYAKWLEAGGARSIPIPYDASASLLDDIWTQIHGVLLPGGAAAYPETVTWLLDKVVESNKAGNFFPAWGTCLGFEFLIQYGGGPTALQTGFAVENVSLALEHVHPVGLYADPTQYFTVTQLNVTMNNHMSGIMPHQFQKSAALTKRWQITSTNKDLNGRPFVSTIEPVDPEGFPVYGVQYHPEKNAFEYATYPGTNVPYEAIDHSPEGVAFSLSMARFIADLARRAMRENRQHAYTKEALYPGIYTYPIQTGLGFEQVYLIPTADHWTNRTLVLDGQQTKLRHPESVTATATN